MSVVVFIARTEDQLTSGMPWCKAIAEQRGAKVEALILGSEHKVLLKHARQKLNAEFEDADRFSVASVEADLSAVIAHLKLVRCSTLVMVYGSEPDDLQTKLFEQASMPTFWLHASGPPPASAKRLFTGMSCVSDITATVSDRFFGFSPAAILADPFEDEDESPNDAVERMVAQVNANASSPGDLILIGIQHQRRADRVYHVALKLLDHNLAASVALVHGGGSWQESLGLRVQDWFATAAPSDGTGRTNRVGGGPGVRLSAQL